MADKPKIVKINAPIAVAKYPKLTEPDYGSEQFPKPEGEYSVKLVYKETDPAFVKFRNKLEKALEHVDAIAEKRFAELKKATRDKLGEPKRNELFTPIYDEDDEPTGEVEMRVAMKASGVVKRGPKEGKKWSRKPQLFDAFGNAIKKAPAIWGGSELIVAMSYMEDGYFVAGTGAYGIKLQMEAVQIVTLNDGNAKSASDHGFGAVEGGFDASQLADDDDEDGDDEFAVPGDDDESKPAGDPEGASDF